MRRWFLLRDQADLSIRKRKYARWSRLTASAFANLPVWRSPNAISLTFTRMARAVDVKDATFYRLRHTFKTLGKRSRDREALDLAMGHRDGSTGKIYDHSEISWRRIRRVARAVHRGLWPKVKRSVDTMQSTTSTRIAGSDPEPLEAA